MLKVLVPCEIFQIRKTHKKDIRASNHHNCKIIKFLNLSLSVVFQGRPLIKWVFLEKCLCCLDTSINNFTLKSKLGAAYFLVQYSYGVFDN